MFKPIKPVRFYLLAAFLPALPLCTAAGGSHPSRSGDLDEFDASLSSHNYPQAGYQVETSFNPQWSLTRFIPQEEFIFQGIRVLAKEFTETVTSLTIHAYADDGEQPGEFIFTYDGDVLRGELPDNLVWLELQFPGEYWRVFEVDQPFWVSIGGEDTGAWIVLQDDDGLAGWSLTGSVENGGEDALVSGGDWIMEAGGTYDFGGFDLSAQSLWNDVELYHILTGGNQSYWARIANAGNTPTPAGTCELTVFDEFGGILFSLTAPVPGMPIGGLSEIHFPESWEAGEVGRYTVRLNMDLPGDTQSANNFKTLYQQVIDPYDYHAFDDGSWESVYPVPDGQGLAVMFTPAQQPCKAARMKVYFDRDYAMVQLSAYSYIDFSFEPFWGYSGPVNEGWVTFAMVSPRLVEGAVAVVLEDAGNLRSAMDTSEPPIIPNPEMPFTYFLTDGETWNPDPPINGKPLVQVAFEYPTAEPVVQVNLEPVNGPIEIEPGDSFGFSAVVQNTLQAIEEVDIWTEITWPTGEHFGPLQLLDNVDLIPGVDFTIPEQHQSMPMSSPYGIYQFRMNVGDYPLTIATFDAFNVLIYDGTDVEDHRGGAAAPESALIVGAPGPNPFNTATTVRVTLADAGRINAALYDITGRLVRTLHGGIHPAGSSQFSINGSNLASGLYFVRVQMDDSAPVLRKITLIK